MLTLNQYKESDYILEYSKIPGHSQKIYLTGILSRRTTFRGLKWCITYMMELFEKTAQDQKNGGTHLQEDEEKRKAKLEQYLDEKFYKCGGEFKLEIFTAASIFILPDIIDAYRKDVFSRMKRMSWCFYRLKDAVEHLVTDTLDEIDTNFSDIKDRREFCLLPKQFMLSAIAPLSRFIVHWTLKERTLKLPLVQEGTYEFNIDWGDGTSDQITEWDQAEVKHIYAEKGTYRVVIDGSIRGFNVPTDSVATQLKHSLISNVEQWGCLETLSCSNMFRHNNLLTITATDAPDLRACTDMSYMFAGCKILNHPLGHWDVSGISNMSHMFQDCFQFNQDLSMWDVSNVTDMSNMFEDCRVFNQNIGGWNVSNVTNMNRMLYDCNRFNQDISRLDVSSVTKMDEMLVDCYVLPDEFRPSNGLYNELTY